MICRARSRKPALLLAVGAYRAAASPACVSEAASAPIDAPNGPNSISKRPQSWASIEPAAFKEPIDNPHRLDWHEWAFLASDWGIVLVLSAGAMRVARR